LIGVTAPAVTQLTVAGKAEASPTGANSPLTYCPALVSKHEMCSEHSAYVISANPFNPTVDVAVGSAFQFKIHK